MSPVFANASLTLQALTISIYVNQVFRSHNHASRYYSVYASLGAR